MARLLKTDDIGALGASSVHDDLKPGIRKNSTADLGTGAERVLVGPRGAAASFPQSWGVTNGWAGRPTSEKELVCGSGKHDDPWSPCNISYEQNATSRGRNETSWGESARGGRTGGGGGCAGNGGGGDQGGQEGDDNEDDDDEGRKRKKIREKRYE